MNTRLGSAARIAAALAAGALLSGVASAQSRWGDNHGYTPGPNMQDAWQDRQRADDWYDDGWHDEGDASSMYASWTGQDVIVPGADFGFNEKYYTSKVVDDGWFTDVVLSFYTEDAHEDDWWDW